MAMIGLSVPESTARLLSDIEVPGSPSPEPHITILNLGDDVPIETVAKMMVSAYSVVSKVRPFTVRTNIISCFPNDGKVPVIAKVVSPALHTLRENLCKVFDDQGIYYSKSFKDYVPHVTLAWNTSVIEDFEVPSVEWGAHELCLWGGNSGSGRVLVNLPFSLGNRKASRVPVEADIVKVLRLNRVVRKFRAWLWHD